MAKGKMSEGPRRRAGGRKSAGGDIAPGVEPHTAGPPLHDPKDQIQQPEKPDLLTRITDAWTGMMQGLRGDGQSSSLSPPPSPGTPSGEGFSQDPTLSDPEIQGRHYAAEETRRQRAAEVDTMLAKGREAQPPPTPLEQDKSFAVDDVFAQAFSVPPTTMVAGRHEPLTDDPLLSTEAWDRKFATPVDEVQEPEPARAAEAEEPTAPPPKPVAQDLPETHGDEAGMARRTFEDADRQQPDGATVGPPPASVTGVGETPDEPANARQAASKAEQRQQRADLAQQYEDRKMRVPKALASQVEADKEAEPQEAEPQEAEQKTTATKLSPDQYEQAMHQMAGPGWRAETELFDKGGPSGGQDGTSEASAELGGAMKELTGEIKRLVKMVRDAGDEWELQDNG